MSDILIAYNRNKTPMYFMYFIELFSQKILSLIQGLIVQPRDDIYIL